MRSAQSGPDGSGAWMDLPAARAALEHLGFRASADLPDRPGPAVLLVAIRPVPTLRHFDPERIRYWVSEGGRGRLREITYATPMPLESDFSWGLIRIVDRLGISNEYLAFGGTLSAGLVDGAVTAVFTSPAPILRRGGHSQGWDHGGEAVGAFFGRLTLAVDYVPGFEARLAAATPLERFSAFVAEAGARLDATAHLRDDHADLWALLAAERRHLRLDAPAAWAGGLRLLEAVQPART